MASGEEGREFGRDCGGLIDHVLQDRLELGEDTEGTDDAGQGSGISGVECSGCFECGRRDADAFGSFANSGIGRIAEGPAVAIIESESGVVGTPDGRQAGIVGVDSASRFQDVKRDRRDDEVEHMDAILPVAGLAGADQILAEASEHPVRKLTDEASAFHGEWLTAVT